VAELKGCIRRYFFFFFAVFFAFFAAFFFAFIAFVLPVSHPNRVRAVSM
jgi:hypothetical protein